MMLNIGDKAPEFTLLSDKNEKITLKNFLGKKVILYFYPKDNTPGCSKQACNFRDNLIHFNSHNSIILGISKDNVEKHQKFKEKYQIPFTLLSDPMGEVCEMYGVFTKKILFGRSFLGIERSTFLIDERGDIRAIWRKVKVNGHAEQVIKKLDPN